MRCYGEWIFLLLPVPLLSSCYRVNLVNEWSSGYRADLIIMPNVTVNGWVVDIITDTPLDKFEAWKGSVEAQEDRKHYTVSSKCYNHLVYSCQCLVIPYLVRTQTGQPVWPVSYQVVFNSQEIEQCAELPVCGDLPVGTSPDPTQSDPRMVDFDDISWMVEEDSHTCFLNPCTIPTSCQAPSKISFTCLCPQMFLNIDTDSESSNATLTNPCEKEDLNLNLALALSETEINEVTTILVAANETATQKKKFKRSTSQGKVYIYSFVDSVRSIGNIMKAANVCRLFSELDEMDLKWPNSSLTCSQATQRYTEIESILNTFQLEEKFSLAMEYRKLSSALGLDTIRDTGEIWFSFFVFYTQEWLELLHCNYNGNKCITKIGGDLCKYGDCCGPSEICISFLGGYQCVACPEGTTKVDDLCQPACPYENHPANKTACQLWSTLIALGDTTTTTLLPVIAGQEAHCPYPNTPLCDEWCLKQELEHGVKCAEVVRVA